MPELASQARLVGRDELLPSRTPSPEPVDPEASTYAAAAFQQLFGSIETVDAFAQPSNTADAANQGEEEEEQEYEFRLFRDQPAPEKSDAVESGDKKESEGVQKLRIRLRSPSPGAEGPGGFTVPFRGWDYYFSRPNDILQGTSHQSELPAGTLEVYAKRHSEYTDIAVTAEDVLDFSKEQKPGCHLSWRVVRLKPSSDKTRSSTTAPQLENPALKPRVPKSRKKPGKKRRIVLRQRVKSKKEAEEADREKRTARNREKKLKRRQREREKKATTQPEQGETASGNDGASSPVDVPMADEQ